jgi:signal peptidase II
MRNWLILSVLLFAADQASKYWVSHSLALGQSIVVAPFMNLVLVHNRGAAFSFLSQASGWQHVLFIAIAIAASLWIVYMLWKYPRQRLFCAALSLILSGAVGNLVDRLLWGAVIDFLDFHYRGYHWPAFNVADSAITCGALLLVLDSFLRPARKR